MIQCSEFFFGCVRLFFGVGVQACVFSLYHNQWKCDCGYGYRCESYPIVSGWLDVRSFADDMIQSHCERASE